MSKANPRRTNAAVLQARLRMRRGEGHHSKSPVKTCVGADVEDAKHIGNCKGNGKIHLGVLRKGAHLQATLEASRIARSRSVNNGDGDDTIRSQRAYPYTRVIHLYAYPPRVRVKDW